MVNNIFLGLGSNKGDRLSFLKKAVDRISSDSLTQVEKVSSVYETIPYGVKEQDNFLNSVIKIKSDRQLKELLLWIKNLEKEIGRIEGSKWGPREIDIDLLFYNNVIYQDGMLKVPHREVLLRDFVIVPLAEIAGEFVHPVTGQMIKDIDKNNIEKLVVQKLSINLLS